MDLFERCKSLYSGLNYELGSTCLSEIRNRIRLGQGRYPDNVKAQEEYAIHRCFCDMERRHKLLPVQWIAELKQVAVDDFDFQPQAAETLDFDSYICSYYFDGADPYEALAEDMSYA